MDTAEAYRSLGRPPLTPLAPSPTIEVFASAVNESAAETGRRKQEIGEGSARLANDFEPLVLRRFPELAQVKKILLQAGAQAASLSGSGSAVYGLFREAARARRAAQQLQGRGAHVFLARTVSRREFQAQFGRPANRALVP